MSDINFSSGGVGLGADQLNGGADGITSEAELEEQFGEIVISMILFDEIFDFIAENE